MDNRQSLAALQRRLATVKAAQPAPAPAEIPAPAVHTAAPEPTPEPRTMTRLLRRIYLIFIAEQFRK
jgi:hypothetical protein